MEKIYLGFDIGGTKCAVSLCALSGEEKPAVLRRESFATPVSEREALNQMLDLAQSLTRGMSPVRAGISAGNPMDAGKGMFLNPPNLPGWQGISWTDAITKRFGIPATMENDANACALAEWFWGAGRGCDNMVFLTFGTGMGAGLILNGALYSGKQGNAGELGHWRLHSQGPVGFGKLGSFEGFCSGGGIRQLGQAYCLRERQKGTPIPFDEETVSAKQIAELAREGHPAALEIFQTVGHELGRGLSYVIDLLNPERIIMGSIFARCEDLLRPPMEAVLREECLSGSLAHCQILPAGLGESVGDFATLAVAIHEERKNQ